MCIRCGKNPAEVPDRRAFTGGRFMKQVCSACHSGLLRKDLLDISRKESEKVVEG